MELSADWFIVGLTAAGMAGALVGWLIGRRDKGRTIQPIATLRDRRLEIINRCDEPLRIDEIRAETRLGVGDPVYDDRTADIVGYHYAPSPISPGWEVPPNSVASWPLWLEDPSETTIEIVVTSSLRTLDRKVITVCRSQP